MIFGRMQRQRVGDEEVGLAGKQRRDHAVPIEVQEGDLNTHFLRHQLRELDGAAGALALGVDQGEWGALRLYRNAQFPALDDLVEGSGICSAGHTQQGKSCDEKLGKLHWRFLFVGIVISSMGAIRLRAGKNQNWECKITAPH
jgi:hypothetical protein